MSTLNARLAAVRLTSAPVTPAQVTLWVREFLDVMPRDIVLTTPEFVLACALRDQGHLPTDAARRVLASMQIRY